MSTHGPILLNEASQSDRVVAPIVIENGERAGERLQALAWFPLPAEATTVTPKHQALSTAASRHLSPGPPKDIETTAGLRRLLIR